MLNNKKKKVDLVSVLVIVAILFAVDILAEMFVPRTSLFFSVVKKSCVYALVAVSMNLLNGFTGLFSLGQAGFMLIGAYAYAILTIPAEMRDSVYQYFDGGLIKEPIFWPLALIVAGLVAGIFAFLIGLPVLRLKSDYLAIATLGFAEIIRAFVQWDKFGPLTNGSNLLRGYPTFDSLASEWFGSPKFSSTIALAITAVCILIIVLFINSTYGRALKAIRDDEIAAEAMGINLARHKQISFIISSFFAGVGGALLAMHQSTIQATAFESAMTYEILLIVVVGGIGSISGSCISSFLYIAASEWWLRGLDSGSFLGIQSTLFRGGFRKVVFSVIIMIIVLFFRQGIMGDRELSFTRIAEKFKRKSKKEPSTKEAEKEVAAK
ncbi:MAG: branched-chain amino acid ABC transporter permease [Oscillospiraceae bacterium]|nr:branched-chain amino acid ABC transporter permease [Oscillospiraceae bacterium]MDD7293742.1 branched-chain amino acid ABC transporter permease [Clostridiaceae bacterium]MDY5991228.1 branched-chain amino acid ABC transporter permease [Oscillospiraceae bacterium]